MNKTILAIALLIGSTGSAMAADVSSASNYTFLEGGYVNVDPDFAGGADGAYIRGSYQFGESGVYVAGRASRVEVDGTDYDLNQYDVGVGYHRPLAERVDGFVEAAGVRLEGDGGFDADGYRATAGVKVDVTDAVEGVVQANYYNGDDFIAETTATLGVKYSFTPNWAATAGAEFAEGGNTYNLGVRYSF